MQHTLTADTTHLRPAPRPTPLNTRTLWAALALVHDQLQATVP